MPVSNDHYYMRMVAYPFQRNMKTNKFTVGGSESISQL
jgi:hypothetical protein